MLSSYIFSVVLVILSLITILLCRSLWLSRTSACVTINITITSVLVSWFCMTNQTAFLESDIFIRFIDHFHADGRSLSIQMGNYSLFIRWLKQYMCHLCWFLNYLWFLPTVFGGNTVLLARLTLETCNSGDAATLIRKKHFQLSWECHWQDHAHSLLPSKSLSPTGKVLLYKQHWMQERLIPKCGWKILHRLAHDMLLSYASETDWNSPLVWLVNLLKIFLLNQCNHGCTVNYNLGFIAINICWNIYC